ncbi:hypothetical protein PBR20603_01516 [Pandoraea bronchicola]|uniref:Uncharacterized protein n=2 Tax=Pandoraea bronchicola TaxID=2508287 RepID=A0A5E5BTB4_9BURK|nr:hypothetical protein PBR20603_01516 [Pandoraea bronchicola]
MDRITELELQVTALGAVVQLLLGTHPEKSAITEILENVRDTTKSNFPTQAERDAIEAAFEPFILAGRGSQTSPAA